MGVAGLDGGADEPGVVVVSGFFSLLQPAVAAVTIAAEAASTVSFRTTCAEEFIGHPI